MTGDEDERMGWAFVLHRNGFLDVEELFVRPQYRRQGISGHLVERILYLSHQLGQPLRLWVPFSDWELDNRGLVEKIAERLGLALFDSPVKWAAAVGATSDEGRRSDLTPASANKPNRARPRHILLTVAGR
jgi:GNAT superfamily N-acetyltransferase